MTVYKTNENVKTTLIKDRRNNNNKHKS